MKKPIIGERIVVSQSTTEAIRAGGWQDPEIKNSDGVLYVRFSGKMRKIYEQYSSRVESFGLDEAWLDNLCACYAKFAELSPDVLWIEDDFRLHNHHDSYQ